MQPWLFMVRGVVTDIEGEPVIGLAEISPAGEKHVYRLEPGMLMVAPVISTGNTPDNAKSIDGHSV